MALDDVPTDDMFWFGSRDPLDASLRGESEDPAIDVLVHDLRAAYLPQGTRPRSEALAAFAGPANGVALGTVGARPPAAAVPDRPVPVGRRIAVGAAAFAATITGKVVLGGAVAAATLGGLHASETVDVPLLPRSPQTQTVPSTVPELSDAVDPRRVLVGPPADSPTGASDGAPRVDRPAPAPQPDPADRAPAPPTDRGTASDDDRPDRVSPPTTRPADTPAPADPPGPSPARPDEQPPAADEPGGMSEATPDQDGAGTDRPPGGEPSAPAPTAADRETATRP